MAGPRDEPPVRLVVADLDDTLLDERHRLQSEVVQAVAGLRRRGIGFTVATGRFFPSAASWARRLGVTLPIIAASGAVIRPPTGGKPLLDLRLPPETARRALELTAPLPGIRYLFRGNTVSEDVRPGASPDLIHAARSYSRTLEATLQPFAALDRSPADDRAESPTMIVLRLRPDAAARVTVELTAVLGGQARVLRSLPYLVEILPPGACKGAALEALAAHLNIPCSRVLAVGDGPGDVPMIRRAGIGVLVANSPPELHRHADYVSPLPRQQGAVEAMRRFALSGPGTGHPA